MMKVHSAAQGSAEWVAERAGRYNAADAAAMLGCDPNGRTRTQLLDAMVRGIAPEAGSFKERLYEKGHQVEALTRPLAEGMVGEDLYPLVGSLDVGLAKPLGASFDGLTMARDTNFECKSLNEALAAALPAEDDPDANDAAALHKGYRAQMEQQLLVSGAERVLFCAAAFRQDGTTQSLRACWYRSDTELRKEILAGWKQLEEDAKTHVPADAAPVVVAAPVAALPTVFVQVTGAIAITDNFDAFQVAMQDFLEHRLIRDPKSDQDFADLDVQIKAMKGAEAALETAEAGWIAQIDAVSKAKGRKDMLHKLVRDNRLMAEKLLATEKERRRGEIVAGGVAALRAHVDALNVRLGKPYMPPVVADFAGAIKGKRELSSMENAVNTELARAKIAANEAADRIDANLRALRELASEHAFLFADTAQIVLKAPDDCRALIENRIAAHKLAEEKKEAETRERIRQEEADRIETENAQANKMRMSEISGIQQQVMIASIGRAGVRKGGTIECIRETLAETEGWRIEEVNFGPLTAVAQGAKDKAIADIRALLTEAERAAAQPAPTPAPAQPLAAAPIASPAPVPAASAANSSVVVPMQRAAAPATPPTLRLGQIGERLGFDLRADFLAQLGFAPAATEKASKLFHEQQFDFMCEALIAHVRTVQAKYAQRAA